MITRYLLSDGSITIDTTYSVLDWIRARVSGRGDWLIGWLIGVVSRFGNLDATLIDNPYQEFLSSTRLPNWLHVAAERTQYDSGKKSITRAWMPDGSRPFRFAVRISGGSAATLLCTLGQYHAKNRKRETTTMSFSTGLNSPTIAPLSAVGGKKEKKKKRQFYSMEHSEHVRA